MQCPRTAAAVETLIFVSRVPLSVFKTGGFGGVEAGPGN